MTHRTTSIDSLDNWFPFHSLRSYQFNKFSFFSLECLCVFVRCETKNMKSEPSIGRWQRHKILLYIVRWPNNIDDDIAAYERCEIDSSITCKSYGIRSMSAAGAHAFTSLRSVFFSLCRRHWRSRRCRFHFSAACSSQYAFQRAKNRFVRISYLFFSFGSLFLSSYYDWSIALLVVLFYLLFVCWIDGRPVVWRAWTVDVRASTLLILFPM